MSHCTGGRGGELGPIGTKSKDGSHLYIVSVNIHNELTTARSLNYGLSCQIQQRIVNLAKWRPQNVDLGLLDTAGAPVLDLIKNVYYQDWEEAAAPAPDANVNPKYCHRLLKNRTHSLTQFSRACSELNEDIFHDVERRDRDTMFLSHGSHLLHEWDQN